MTKTSTRTKRPRRRGTDAAPATVRVAIYTRKSVSEGLDQEFNTLDAQREAVEAYVLSQRGEGWQALPERYDDGGFTGANTERPAFQRLLGDVKGGRVDVIAVYKIDRLSRSLADFSRLMELFERHGVSFVSVTQQFNSTSSMGRLTLNILMSFAEFERETIAERTRDKMLASRRRGMWTGGRPVLGYDAVEKRLVVNEGEAEQIRAIFQTYLELGSLLSVVDELRKRGWKTKSWTNQKGKRVRGRPFTKTSLHGLLTNPLYVGKVRAGDELHDGAHEAIVDIPTWKAVDQQLLAHGTGRNPMRSTRSNKYGALLKGIARCACGAALTYTYTKRGSRQYGYYVCVRSQKEGAEACPGSRVPVGELDAFVLDQVRAIGRDPRVLESTLAADQEAREERRPELVADVRRLTGERTRLRGERERLVDAIAQGGTSASVLTGRLDEMEQEGGEVVASLRAAQDELAALERGGVDPEELRGVLDDLEPVWDELFPRERGRLLELLLEEVVFYAEDGDVELAFREGGPSAVRDGGMR